MGPGSRASSMDRVFSPGRMENLIKVRGKADTSTARAQRSIRTVQSWKEPGKMAGSWRIEITADIFTHVNESGA